MRLMSLSTFGKTAKTHKCMLLRKAILWLLLLQMLHQVTAQNQNTYRHQISVQHDNDFVFAIDRYYTTGSFVRYDHLLKDQFIFKPVANAPLQLSLELGQQTFTPRELFESDFDLLERPYAGYLFTKAWLSRASAVSVWELGAELGLAGPQSQAGAFQVAYHKLINEFIPVWAGEIANSVHVNTEASYYKDVKIARSNVLSYLTWQSKVALGTRSSFVQQGVFLYLGDRAAAYESSAFGRLGQVSEFYGFSGLSLKYVINNALVEGHPFGDDSPFTLSAVPFVWQWDSGLRYRSSRMTYQAVYHWLTNETRREGPWHYMSFSVGIRF